MVKWHKNIAVIFQPNGFHMDETHCGTQLTIDARKGWYKFSDGCLLWTSEIERNVFSPSWNLWPDQTESDLLSSDILWL